MDKYEYNIKSDQIKKLYSRKEFEAAAKIADEIDWIRVKDNTMINRVADIYENVKQYEKAKEVLLIAYERSPLGRQLAYKLTILALRTKNFVEADEFYQDFVEMSPSDVTQYLLKYRIAKAKGEDVEVLIRILEAYVEVEMDERWQYELAKLYHEVGEDDKCIAMCDELELWFNEGKYVEKAKELRKLITGVLSEYNRRYASESSVNHVYADIDKNVYDDSEENKKEVNKDILNIPVFNSSNNESEEEESSDEDDEIKEFARALIESEEEEKSDSEGEDDEDLEELDENFDDDYLDDAMSSEENTKAAVNEAAIEVAKMANDAEKAMPVLTPEEIAANEALKAAEKAALEAQKAADLARKLVEEARKNALQASASAASDLDVYDESEEPQKVEKAAKSKFDGMNAEEISRALEEEDLLKGNSEISSKRDSMIEIFEFDKSKDGKCTNIGEELTKTAEIDIEEINIKLEETENLYNTANIQAALAKSMEKILDDERTMKKDRVAFSAHIDDIDDEIRPSKEGDSGYIGDVQNAIIGDVAEEPMEEPAAEPTEEPTAEHNDEIIEEESIESTEEVIEDQQTDIAEEETVAAKEEVTEAAEEVEEVAEVSEEEIEAVSEEVENSLAEQIAAIVNEEDTEEVTEEASEEISEETVENVIEEQSAEVTEAPIEEEAAEEVAEEIAVEAVEDGLAIEEKEMLAEIFKPEVKAVEPVETETKIETEEDDDFYLQDDRYENDEPTKRIDRDEINRILNARKNIYQTAPIPTELITAALKDEAEEEDEQIKGQMTIDEVLAEYERIEAEKVEEDSKAAEDEINDVLAGLDTIDSEEEKSEENVEEKESVVEEEPALEDIEPALEDVDEEDESESEEKVEPVKEVVTKPVKVGRIPDEYRAIFNDFVGTGSMEEDIASVLDNLINKFTMDGTSKTNNVIITGSAKIGKTTLGLSLIKAANRGRNRNGRRVAKVKASALNKRGVAPAMTQILGTDLIIEQAGNLMPNTLIDLMIAMKNYTEEMLIILEDDKAAIDRMIANTPDLKEFFNNRLDIHEMEINDMVKIARDYAEEQMYEIDDMGELALYAKLDDISGRNPVLSIEDIQEVVDDAIEHANRFSFGKLFGRRRVGKDNMGTLTEQDFL